MPSPKSVSMHFVWLVVLAAGPAASAPARAQEVTEVPAPAAGPARRLPGRYDGFEPSVAADPKGRVLIAAMDHGPDKLKKKLQPLIAWRSGDRGVTWSEPRSMGSHPMSDVWLQADPRGGFLAAYMQQHGTSGFYKAVFRRSEDGGQTWKEGQVVGGLGADKTVLAISPSGSRLAVAFINMVQSAVLFRSDDRGEHWQKIPRIGAGGVVDYANLITGLVVNDDGAIVAAWTLGGTGSLGSVDSKSVRKLVVSTTKDAGKTWKDLQLASYTDSQVEPAKLETGPGVALALDSSAAAHAVYCYPAGDKKDYRLLYRRSTDLQAWSDPVPLSSGNADDFRGFPAVAAAGDRVHVTWMERSGGLFNVWYRGSADGGKTWSKPICLSRPERPTDLLTAKGFQVPGGHYMSLAEDGRGTAHAAWGVHAERVPGGEIWQCAVRLRPAGRPAK